MVITVNTNWLLIPSYIYKVTIESDKTIYQYKLIADY